MLWASPARDVFGPGRQESEGGRMLASGSGGRRALHAVISLRLDAGLRRDGGRRCEQDQSVHRTTITNSSTMLVLTRSHERSRTTRSRG